VFRVAFWLDVHREALSDWLDERELEREPPPTAQELKDDSALRAARAPESPRRSSADDSL
jgi:hypothetical protein